MYNFSEKDCESIFRLYESVWMYVPPYCHAYASNKSINLLAKPNSSHQANMSAKQSSVAKVSGLVGWLSSWLPSAGLAPVKATKQPMPNLSKGMNIYPLTPGYYLAGIVCCFARSRSPEWVSNPSNSSANFLHL